MIPNSFFQTVIWTTATVIFSGFHLVGGDLDNTNLLQFRDNEKDQDVTLQNLGEVDVRNRDETRETTT